MTTPPPPSSAHAPSPPPPSAHLAQQPLLLLRRSCHQRPAGIKRQADAAPERVRPRRTARTPRAVPAGSADRLEAIVATHNHAIVLVAGEVQHSGGGGAAAASTTRGTYTRWGVQGSQQGAVSTRARAGVGCTAERAGGGTDAHAGARSLPGTDPRVKGVTPLPRGSRSNLTRGGTPLFAPLPPPFLPYHQLTPHPYPFAHQPAASAVAEPDARRPGAVGGTSAGAHTTPTRVHVAAPTNPTNCAGGSDALRLGSAPHSTPAPAAVGAPAVGTSMSGPVCVQCTTALGSGSPGTRVVTVATALQGPLHTVATRCGTTGEGGHGVRDAALGEAGGRGGGRGGLVAGRGTGRGLQGCIIVQSGGGGWRDPGVGNAANRGRRNAPIWAHSTQERHRDGAVPSQQGHHWSTHTNIAAPISAQNGRVRFNDTRTGRARGTQTVLRKPEDAHARAHAHAHLPRHTHAQPNTGTKCAQAHTSTHRHNQSHIHEEARQQPARTERTDARPSPALPCAPRASAGAGNSGVRAVEAPSYPPCGPVPTRCTSSATACTWQGGGGRRGHSERWATHSRRGTPQSRASTPIADSRQGQTDGRGGAQKRVCVCLCVFVGGGGEREVGKQRKQQRCVDPSQGRRTCASRPSASRARKCSVYTWPRTLAGSASPALVSSVVMCAPAVKGSDREGGGHAQKNVQREQSAHPWDQAPRTGRRETVRTLHPRLKMGQ
jgi:hypothetical protein